MDIIVKLPEGMDESMKEAFGSEISRRALELLAIDGYRKGKLSHAEVGRVLGHSGRMETELFLQEEAVPLHYSVEDLEKDVQVLRKVLKKECPA